MENYTEELLEVLEEMIALTERAWGNAIMGKPIRNRAKELVKKIKLERGSKIDLNNSLQLGQALDQIVTLGFRRESGEMLGPYLLGDWNVGKPIDDRTFVKGKLTNLPHKDRYKIRELLTKPLIHGILTMDSNISTPISIHEFKFEPGGAFNMKFTVGTVSEEPKITTERLNQ